VASRIVCGALLAILSFGTEIAVGQTVQVTITSNPPIIPGGRFTFEFEGKECSPSPQPVGAPASKIYSAPETFLWETKAKCDVRWSPSVQASDGSSYFFQHWQNGTALNPAHFDAPPENLILTATFKKAFPVTVSLRCLNNAATAAVPCEGPAIAFSGLAGSTVVSSANDIVALSGWLFADWPATIEARKGNSGLTFIGWGTSNPLNQTNPISDVVKGPATLVANFRKN
jgi:hypothetical protein